MTEIIGFFDIERTGETLLLTPQQRMGEAEYEALHQSSEKIFDLLTGDPPTKNVVLDLTHADHFGSSALGFFIGLWRRVKKMEGRMALCNVSAQGREILEITKLDQLWPICASKEEATQKVCD